MRISKKFPIVFLTAVFIPLAAYAAPTGGNLAQLLMKSAEVSIASRQAEDPFKVPAAVYVITSDEIRRSGATTIADALRLAPGLNVARSSTGEWGISIRGFNNGFSNKLLVLIDGRTVYTPLFSGVYWSVQDVMLEDIKQIEIVRGPGATMWGANAVNGIINIITEEAANTEENIVTATAGVFEKYSISVRQGGSLNDSGSYRVYGKFFERGNLNTLSGTDARDDFNQGRAGFRADWFSTPEHKFTVQGDIYKGDQSLNMTLPSFPNNISREEVLVASGANILGRWTGNLEDGSEAKIQMYVDRTRFDYSLLDQYTHTFDIDYQHSKAISENHNLVWGAGYRSISDSLRDSFNITFEPKSRTVDVWSAFAQDKVTLLPDELYLTVGSKFEHNDFTGFELQPSARLAWHPSNNQTAWASVSRAVRTPSRAEDDIKIIFGNVNGAFVRQEGNRDFDSETLIAYEAGYRIEPETRYLPDSIDISTFFNDYDRLRTASIGSVIFEGGNAFVPVLTGNEGYGESYGIEVTADWDVTKNWRLTANYSFLNMTLHTDSGSSDTELAEDERRSPKNQFNLLSRLDLPEGFEFDTSLYYTDNLGSFHVPAYVRLDARLGWEYSQSIMFDIIGQNLTDNNHPEFAAPFYISHNQVPRILYGRVTWRF